MQMPKKSRVGPFQWVHKKVKREKGDPFGETVHEELALKIFESHPHIERETSCHEHLHAMFWVSGVSTILGENREEQIVSMLSPVLFQFIQENPQMIEWWQDEKFE